MWFNFPWRSSFEECLWVVNVEDHTTHCRLASAIIMLVQSVFGLPLFSSLGECLWVVNVEAYASHLRMSNQMIRDTHCWWRCSHIRRCQLPVHENTTTAAQTTILSHGYNSRRALLKDSSCRYTKKLEAVAQVMISSHEYDSRRSLLEDASYRDTSKQ